MTPLKIATLLHKYFDQEIGYVAKLSVVFVLTCLNGLLTKLYNFATINETKK